MADWQRTLYLQPEWDQASDDGIALGTLAGVIAKRLRALKPFDDEYLDGMRDDIADEFESLRDDPDADRDWFNAVMDNLYDWADMRLDGDVLGGKKVCWVDRFTARQPVPQTFPAHMMGEGDG